MQLSRQQKIPREPRTRAIPNNATWDKRSGKFMPSIQLVARSGTIVLEAGLSDILLVGNEAGRAALGCDPEDAAGLLCETGAGGDQCASRRQDRSIAPLHRRLLVGGRSPTPSIEKTACAQIISRADGQHLLRSLIDEAVPWFEKARAAR